MSVVHCAFPRGAFPMMLMALTVFSLPCAATEPLVRIKDITQLAGEHPNQISGLGLVVGLAGTGGSSGFNCSIGTSYG